MKPLFLPCLCLALAACAAAPASLPSATGARLSVPDGSTDALVARGAAFAAENCASCHATGETGNSPHPMAPAFRDISKRYPVRQLSEAFAEGIVTAHPDMPEFILTPDDNRSLIAYLETVQTPGTPTNRERDSGDLPIS